MERKPSQEQQTTISRYVLLGEKLFSLGLFEGLERAKETNDLNYAIQVLNVMAESVDREKELLDQCEGYALFGTENETVPREEVGEFLAKQSLRLNDEMRFELNRLSHRISEMERLADERLSMKWVGKK